MNKKIRIMVWVKGRTDRELLANRCMPDKICLVYLVASHQFPSFALNIFKFISLVNVLCYWYCCIAVLLLLLYSITTDITTTLHTQSIISQLTSVQVSTSVTFTNCTNLILEMLLYISNLNRPLVL